jgi:acyl carrier protein
VEVNKVDNIFDRVKDVIVEQLGIEDESSITTATTFIDDLGADSLDVVELIMALEEEFGIEVPEVEAEKIVSVGDVVEYIKSVV